MAWYPEAIRKEIPRHSKRVATQRNRMNLHVAVSEASSLYGFFSGAGVCSHFYVRRDGVVEQYIDTKFYSAADLEGNDATISVETQGGLRNADSEPWTDAQIEAIAKLWAWAAETHGIPNVLAQDSVRGSTSRGLSWHRLGVDPWRKSNGMKYSKARGKLCPGLGKIGQIPQIQKRSLNLADGNPGKPTPDKPTSGTPNKKPEGNGGSIKTYLSLGDKGAEVKRLQQRLKELGYYKGSIDSVFGRQTLAAVRSFQAAAKLVIDGLVGPATKAAVYSSKAPRAKLASTPVAVLRRGSRGSQVVKLQRKLNANYPLYSKLVVDGLYGPAVEGVVKEFQRRSGLKVDGIVGPQTRKALGL